MSKADHKTLDLQSLADATENGPALIQRAGYPGLIVMREDTYAQMLDQAQTVKPAAGDELFSDPPAKPA